VAYYVSKGAKLKCSMGYIEVESRFFDALEEYRAKMINNGIKDIKIKVMVKYPNDNHITNYKPQKELITL
jgi:hypothetical protein